MKTVRIKVLIRYQRVNEQLLEGRCSHGVLVSLFHRFYHISSSA